MITSEYSNEYKSSSLHQNDSKIYTHVVINIYNMLLKFGDHIYFGSKVIQSRIFAFENLTRW